MARGWKYFAYYTYTSRFSDYSTLPIRAEVRSFLTIHFINYNILEVRLNRNLKKLIILIIWRTQKLRIKSNTVNKYDICVHDVRFRHFFILRTNCRRARSQFVVYGLKTFCYFFFFFNIHCPKYWKSSENYLVILSFSNIIVSRVNDKSLTYTSQSRSYNNVLVFDLLKSIETRNDPRPFFVLSMFLSMFLLFFFFSVTVIVVFVVQNVRYSPVYRLKRQ